MNNNQDKQLIIQEQEINNLSKIAYTLDKAYMTKLDSEYGIIKYNDIHNLNENENSKTSITYEDNIRGVKVTKWVFDREENPGKCFKNVLSAFADGDHSLALVVKRTPTDTQMFFVIKNEGEGREYTSETNHEILEDTITGNFQGTEIEKLDDEESLKKEFSFGNDIHSIAILTNSPSEYSEDYVGQGLDKLLNGVIPEENNDSYTVVFLAESLSSEALMEIISGYEEMATSLHPFEQYTFGEGVSLNATMGETTSVSNSKNISKSISKVHSVNKNKSSNVSGNLIFIGGNSGKGKGYGYSEGKTETDSESKTESTSGQLSLALGLCKDITYTYKSYKISNMLERVKTIIERLNKSKATGLWKYSTYIMSDESKTTKKIANVLKGITQGKNSYLEPAFIQEWSDENNEVFSEIKKYISYFTHPVFGTVDKNGNNEMAITPTSYVTTDELSNVIVFPKKSLQGLPVLQGTQFGREPHSSDVSNFDLPLGKGYHMHKIYDKQTIAISSKDLVNHTFICGTTGSGKSNAVYKLIEKSLKKGVKFLVIEPAKGEYKSIFGNRTDVSVYGTNTKLTNTQLLRINPFYFPIDKRSVIEHIEGLLEIFNICWPMYAAMPAVLKEALEQAYINAGWDLLTSENKYDDRIFPTFSDVLAEIKNVMESSEYSGENKANYKGALVTRIKQLTNGIYGQIFSNDFIPDKELFDENVIIDLSRIPSTEIQSLIMGLLVLKLREYRDDHNSEIKHLTIIEEAHNLLIKTSTEYNSETSNIQKKSVEMLSKAISEMRTYGEGFVIVDQSPGLLDMSVIRNTSTKIMLNLPDYSDRELVGKSVGLNEEQINELGRLKTGVAVLYQKGWLEPVLCKINEFNENIDKNTKNTAPNKKIDNSKEDINKKASEALLEAIMTDKISDVEKNSEKLNSLQKLIIKSNLETSVKCGFCLLLKNNISRSSFRKLCFDYFNASNIIEQAKNDYCNIEDFACLISSKVYLDVKKNKRKQINKLLYFIVEEAYCRNLINKELFSCFLKYHNERGGILK